jgi:hypothetical protein
MGFVAVLFVGALVLSLGHKLVWHREVVNLGGLTVYLPMGIYRHVPILGAVVQHGRYLVIGYMAMSIGVAGLVRFMRTRYGPSCAVLTALVAGALVCTDYAFRFVATPLPPCPIERGEGTVMDPRLWTGTTVYRQTLHGRPLVGGYVARVTDRWEKRYKEMPGIGWFFHRSEKRGPPPSCSEIAEAIDALNIEYIDVNAAGPERELLESCGYHAIHVDESGVTLSTRETATK